MKPKIDPTISRIREVRHQISEEHDHDPYKLVEHYIAIQQEYIIAREKKLGIAQSEIHESSSANLFTNDDSLSNAAPNKVA